MEQDQFFKIKELFWKNEHIPYVITDGWGCLLDPTAARKLDVLALHRDEFVHVLGLKKEKDPDEENRPLFSKFIEKKKWLFEVREPGDDFWARCDEERVLKGRVKDERLNVYLLHPSDEFWSMLYHATYHIKSPDAPTIAHLHTIKPGDYSGAITDKEYAHNWLIGKGFFPVRAKDKSLGYFVP